ncbi:gamma-interferon-inducible protein 16 [Equus quagga]|uniref:gamma-interferon-inducible protein 16 n=1 Tax=Equus quagga TaxID=89248 RepID=UPI001EE23C40|nr:gamma-interferon-inducible protein 16 [Equus quagga]
MVNEYQKIVLLKGLEPISAYHFSMVKSLLVHDLQLTAKPQDEYSKIEIAKLMAEKHRGATCVDKLIELYKDIPELKSLVKNLRSEKLKVAVKKRKKGATQLKKRDQREAGPAAPAPTTSSNVTSERAEKTPVAQRRRNTTKENTGTKKKKVTQEQIQPVCPSVASTSAIMGNPPPPQISSFTPSSTFLAENQIMQVQHQRAAGRGFLQKGPMIVMVLKATKPFEYESPETGKKKMFHATVATTSQYFQVKVLNINLKEKFTKKKIITISDYFECKGILEVNEASSVSEAGIDQKIEVPTRIIKSANQTPKIDNLHKQASGTFVYGLFVLHQKKVNNKNTIYEIEDKTGKMDVVGNGKWHNIKCEEGDKLRLFCFQLRTLDKRLKLTCGNHSFIQKPRLKAVPKEASREEGFQRGPKEVMVLKATEPFAYAVSKGERKMFHATVATESQFFQVKVFDISLKEKFIPKEVIAISDYVGCNGYLEVYNALSVSDVNADQKMEVSKSLIANANATPKISHLYLQAPGTFVNGMYEVHKKTVRNQFIYYEIKDNTGKIEVRMYGRLTQINCEEGDKLKLICFELALSENKWQLRSVIHSFIKVIKARKSKIPPLNPDSYMKTSLEFPFELVISEDNVSLNEIEMQSEFKKIILLKGLEPINEYQFSMVKFLLASDLKLTRKAQNEYNRIQIADLMTENFPRATCVDKLIELYKDIAELKQLAKTLKNEKLKVISRWKARGTTPVKKSKQDKSTCTMNKALGPELITYMPVMKKKKNKSIKTEESKMQLTQEQSQLPEPSGTSTLSTESNPQTPRVSPPTPPSTSSTKKSNGMTIKTNNSKKMLSPKQSQLRETSATSSCPSELRPQTPQMLLPVPSSSSSNKKRKDTITKTDDSKRMKLFWEQSLLPEAPTTSTCPTEGCRQMPQMPPPTPSSSSLIKKPRLKAVPKEASREEGFQRGPKEVMVLKATEPFAYAVSKGERKMFHATVAADNQFFQVKVFDVNLKEKFIPKKVIAISDYIGRNGFLEVYNASSVSDVNADRKMEISKSLIASANATPKINRLYLQAPGTFVNGVYQVHKKTVRNQFVYYEIKDNTGKIEVRMYGRLAQINCEKGDKLKLTCFELALSEKKWQLRSVIHSFVKVIKARKSKKRPRNPYSYMKTSLEFS